MASVALQPGAIGHGRGLRARAQAWVARHGQDLILAVPVTLLLIVTFVQLPREVNVDSWLELVTGRLVWDSGIPTHETLTVFSHGMAWVDQQWLSQAVAYGIYRVGGFGLLGVINGVLLVSGAGVATVAARRLGAPFRSVLVILPVGIALMMPSRELRTQAFAVPLFALLVLLLSRDSRSPSRRVFWCLPILAVWANLHGTVTLGAALVVLHGAVTLFGRRRSLLTDGRAWLGPLALIAGAGVSILLTPYGLAMVGYYRSTLVSGTLRSAVTEWQPVTSVPVTATGVFLLLGLAIWSFGHRPSATTPWEKLAVVLVGAGAISVVRNSLFLGLLAMMVVPVSLGWGSDAATAGEDRRTLVNGSLALLTGAAVIITMVATLAAPAARAEYALQRPGVLAAVQRATATDPRLRVIADERFDDWLLWRDPRLAGHIATDVRFELLSAAQIQGLQSLFGQVGAGWKQAARGYRLIVLNRGSDPAAWAGFLHEPGRTVLYRDPQRLVILRSVAAAARA